MNHRPAGMSSDSDDSMEYIHSNNFYLNDDYNLQTGPVRQGFGSLSEQNETDCNSIPNGTSNGFLESHAKPAMSSRALQDHANTNGLSEKAVYLSAESGRRDQPPQPYSSSHKKANRRHNMHRGVVLPLEELRMAATQGNLPVIKDILGKGIAVDQTLKSGWTALMYAASSGNAEVINFLLQKGANPNLHKELFTALMAACAASYTTTDDILAGCVKALIDAGANVNAAERHRMTPLMFASKEGRTHIVEILLDASAPVNEQDNKGWSALSWAASKGHGQIVRLLLENGANAGVVSNYGQKPADVALDVGYPEIADILERASTKKNLEGDMDKLTSYTAYKKKCGPKEGKFGDVEMILTSLGLSALIPQFQQHEISLPLFLRLTEKDLETIGVEALGSRKKITDAVTDMHKQNWKTTSLPNLREVPNLKLADAVAMVSNINMHLKFIHASVGYLRDEIQTKPRILEIGQDQHSVSKLAVQFEDSFKNLSFLKDEVYFFKNHLNQISDNVEFAPADMITNKKNDGRRWHRNLMASIFAVSAISITVWFTKPKLFTKLFSLYYPQRSILLDC